MSGFGIRNDEDDIGVGSHNYLNFRDCDDKMRRTVEFRCTMKTLNQTFVTACQDEISRSPDCILAPLIQNYLLYLRDTLTKLNEDTSDAEKNSFTNIGKFFDSISKKLNCIPFTIDKAVFNNNNKEMPPLKRRADVDIGHYSHNLPFNNPNASTSLNTPLSGGYSSRMTTEGKRLMMSPATDAQKPEKNPFSGFSGFNSVAAPANSLPMSSTGYFSENSSKHHFNDSFGSGRQPKSPSTFNLPSVQAGGSSVSSHEKSTSFFQNNSPDIPSSCISLVSSSFQKSNSNSPTMSLMSTNKIAPVFSSQNSFGLSSTYTNGISPNLAPIMLPKAGGLDVGASKAFSSQQSGTSLGFSVDRQNTSMSNSASTIGFQFSPAPFSSPAPTSVVNNKDSDDEDTEPPKNEFTPVVESDSLYNIKCKVFYMIDGSYKDKGVGQLYVKKLDSGKYQLVVRADNTLGIVILNLLLSKSLPLSKKSAKDIITVDPTGNKGEPATVLIRVKDESSATELLNKLTQFKSSSS